MTHNFDRLTATSKSQRSGGKITVPHNFRGARPGAQRLGLRCWCPKGTLPPSEGTFPVGLGAPNSSAEASSSPFDPRFDAPASSTAVDCLAFARSKPCRVGQRVLWDVQRLVPAVASAGSNRSTTRDARRRGDYRRQLQARATHMLSGRAAVNGTRAVIGRLIAALV